VQGERIGPGTKPAVTAALERLLGLRIDLADFERFAARDARLWPLARRFRGMKPPRFPTVFECLVNAIACQQVSLTVGILLLGRLAGAFGLEAKRGDPKARAFPRTEDLAGRKPEELRPVGFSRQKARALIDLDGAIAEGRLDLEGMATESDEVVLLSSAARSARRDRRDRRGGLTSILKPSRGDRVFCLCRIWKRFRSSCDTDRRRGEPLQSCGNVARRFRSAHVVSATPDAVAHWIEPTGLLTIPPGIESVRRIPWECPGDRGARADGPRGHKQTRAPSVSRVEPVLYFRSIHDQPDFPDRRRDLHPARFFGGEWRARPVRYIRGHRDCLRRACDYGLGRVLRFDNQCVPGNGASEQRGSGFDGHLQCAQHRR
jgi:hypothetical protein